MATPRVFLIETPKAKIDVSRAAEHGELTNLFASNDRRSSVFRSTNFGDEIIAKLQTAEFDYANDFICAAGSMVPVLMLVAVIVSMYPSAKVLFFNSSEARYVARTIGREVWNS